MDTVFIVVRDYDYDGYRIAGIFKTKEEADGALLKNNDDGYGMKDTNEVVELEVGKYFDISDISL